MAKLLSCPQCKSNNLALSISSLNIPIRGETRDWKVVCKECGFNIDYLSKNGTKESAISDWNNMVSEIIILDYLENTENNVLSFDDGIDILTFIESHNYTERRLRIDLSKLSKEYKVDKNEFINHDSELLPIGRKYLSFQITENGKNCLKRLKRDRDIQIKQKNVQ